VVLKTTSNKTEVKKEGGRPPFYPLATTLEREGKNFKILITTLVS
jgi:hypothetical protein